MLKMPCRCLSRRPYITADKGTDDLRFINNIVKVNVRLKHDKARHLKDIVFSVKYEKTLSLNIYL